MYLFIFTHVGYGPICTLYTQLFYFFSSEARGKVWWHHSKPCLLNKTEFSLLSFIEGAVAWPIHSAWAIGTDRRDLHNRWNVWSQQFTDIWWHLMLMGGDCVFVWECSHLLICKTHPLSKCEMRFQLLWLHILNWPKDFIFAIWLTVWKDTIAY